MIAPPSQFETLVAEVGRLAGHVFQRQVGPLAGEQSDRTRHARAPTPGVGRRSWRTQHFVSPANRLHSGARRIVLGNQAHIISYIEYAQLSAISAEIGSPRFWPCRYQSNGT